MDPERIQEYLSSYSGSDTYYRHFTGLRYTEGARMMAELCQAFWLLDAIASYQKQCRQDLMLKDFQIWTFRREVFVGELICERDTGNVAFTQKMSFTDFPLDEIKLYVADNVILLPSEY